MKATLIITTYNRPEYLYQCFESLRHADLSLLEKVIIVDDKSTDQQTLKLIAGFDAHPEPIVVYKKQNTGIKESLKIGYDLAFKFSDIAINLDGDAIVRKDFVPRLLDLKKRFPDRIVSGFNTTVKNRNPIIKEEKDHYVKQYASGINMVINKEQYLKWVLPSLEKQNCNWDFQTSLNSQKDIIGTIVAKDSVLNHIGWISSMNHSDTPDHATDFYLHDLPEVTLIGASCSDLPGLIKAADISTKYIKFGAVKLLSSQPSNDPRVVRIEPLLSKAHYNKFVLKQLANYVDTPYCIIFQGDGYVVNAYSWDDDFLNFDYIGGVWSFNHPEYPGCNVGNGGAALNSKRLLDICRDDEKIIPINDRYIKNYEEDHAKGKIYRKYLEKTHNIKFAPVEVANRFSIEAYGVKPPHNKYNGSFMFHGYGNIDWSEAKLEHIPSKK